MLYAIALMSGIILWVVVRNLTRDWNILWSFVAYLIIAMKIIIVLTTIVG